jgi:hypothetical protein
VLFEAQELAGETTRMLVVADSRPTLLTLRATGMDHVLAIYRSRREALSSSTSQPVRLHAVPELA